MASSSAELVPVAEGAPAEPPTRFATVVDEAWLFLAPLEKVSEQRPSRVAVAALLDESKGWSKHTRVEKALTLARTKPLMWCAFLKAERNEKKGRGKINNEACRKDELRQLRQQATEEKTRQEKRRCAADVRRLAAQASWPSEPAQESRD